LTAGGDKENATTGINAARPLIGRDVGTGKDKKSRSKSLGPGGLDALQDSNGNRRKVIDSLMLLFISFMLKALIAT
jgi:kinetochore protein Spc7/SPC105